MEPTINNKIILLIEDNPDDEALMLRALKSNQFMNKVMVARDGTEAIDYFFGKGAEANSAPAVVLLDLKLPKIDGLEVLRRIRADQRTSLLPIVILTSSREDQDIINGYRLGANSYIRKPVDFAKFTEAVKQIGHYWLGLNETATAQRRLAG